MKTYSALDISRMVGVTKKAVKLRLGEPSSTEAGTNRYAEDSLPQEWRETISLRQSYHTDDQRNVVTFAQVKNEKVKRQGAVLHTAFSKADDLLSKGGHVRYVMEELLRSCHMEMRRHYPGWSMHIRSFHRWHDRWLRGGKTLSAVVLQKQGRFGRKPLAAHLTSEQLQVAKAACVEYGGRVAPAARLLLADPELSHQIKEGMVASPSRKSYVAPSIRSALKTTDLMLSMHHGPRKARTDGAYTERNWDLVAAGEVWQSDDLTPPMYWWVEHPKVPGYLIMQGQWLPILDLGSQMILSHSLIARESRQYTSDDIWSLLGKAIFALGKPSWGVYFERGHWAAARVIGRRTGIDGWEREGALADLGCKVLQATTPNAKVIEGLFEHLQREMQRLPGYRGRNATVEKFEALESDVRKCRNGQCHPRDIGLLHISQMAGELDRIAHKWNHSRNDGKVCKGRTPAEAWAEKLPEGGLQAVPQEAAYMLYANLARVKVTRNGLRVDHGGESFRWDHPESLTRLQGQEVFVWYTPEYGEVATVTTRERQFICHVKRLEQLHPIHATKEELQGEAQRKGTRLKLIRTEYRQLVPSMPSHRRHVIPCDDATARLNEKINDAGRQVVEERANVRSKVQERTARAERLSRYLQSQEEEDVSGVMEQKRIPPPGTARTATREHGQPYQEENTCPVPEQQQSPS